MGSSQTTECADLVAGEGNNEKKVIMRTRTFIYLICGSEKVYYVL